MPFLHNTTVLLCLTLTTAAWLAAAVAHAQPPPHCRRKCGDVDIPYPFGIDGDTPGCYLGHGHGTYGFNVSCNDTGNGVYKPFIWDVELLNISLLQAQVRILMSISSSCYNSTTRAMDPDIWSLDFTISPYRFSHTGNVFTVIGCRTLAYIGGDGKEPDVGSLTTGCVATCQEKDLGAMDVGTCSGIGCCQTAIPVGLQYYAVWFDDRFNLTGVLHNFSRCSYAALMETSSSSFRFTTEYLTSSKFNDSFDGQVPLLLDWAIGNETCEETRRKGPESYACRSKNSECFDSPSGIGYICNCSKGFRGNPYLEPSDPNSCQDIDECMDQNINNCYGLCRNTPGGFDCVCPPGTRGNASVGQCQKVLTHGVLVAIGICTSAIVGLLLFLGIEWIKYKRRINRQDLMNKRDAYFRQHGGQLLIDMMKLESHISFKLYDREDIESATNNFKENTILGQGGQGTVYKGYNLDPENNPVAIKRCKGIDENRKTEFGQELLILSRVRHEYIVKLLGCCLQFEVPVLVYEFVPHKTLHYLIHGQSEASLRTLGIRLKIAAQSAEALAHLHSLDHPIFHGDVKSANILIGDKFTAKVSDFGCSIFRAAADENVNVVKGTIGYLDPEYLMTFQLSDKSDVYSFGIVLLELLTRRKPLSNEMSLASVFQEAMKEGNFREVIDREILHDDNMELLHELAQLASQCIVMDGENRPHMSCVAEILWRLAGTSMSQQHNGTLEAVCSLRLLGNSSAIMESGYSPLETIDYDSQGMNASMNIEFAR
uniref:Protein kinase domain-containing protein n=1 Tax=Leersia perrieri TaxID=77586 RepID=A0A0D9W3V7_9ORYZ